MADRYNIAMGEIPLEDPNQSQEESDDGIKTSITKTGGFFGLQGPNGFTVMVPIDQLKCSYNRTSKKFTLELTGSAAQSLFNDVSRAIEVKEPLKGPDIADTLRSRDFRDHISRSYARNDLPF